MRRHIPNVVSKGALRRQHLHEEPSCPQGDRLSAVTSRGGVVVDPAALSLSIMAAGNECGRTFLDCDLIA